MLFACHWGSPTKRQQFVRTKKIARLAHPPKQILPQPPKQILAHPPKQILAHPPKPKQIPAPDFFSSNNEELYDIELEIVDTIGQCKLHRYSRKGIIHSGPFSAEIFKNC